MKTLIDHGNGLSAVRAVHADGISEDGAGNEINAEFVRMSCDIPMIARKIFWIMH
jgi:hypothetical protein